MLSRVIQWIKSILRNRRKEAFEKANRDWYERQQLLTREAIRDLGVPYAENLHHQANTIHRDIEFYNGFTYWGAGYQTTRDGTTKWVHHKDVLPCLMPAQTVPYAHVGVIGDKKGRLIPWRRR